MADGIQRLQVQNDASWLVTATMDKQPPEEVEREKGLRVIFYQDLKSSVYCKEADPWYDDECRSAKRTARKLERRYKCTLKASSRNRPTATSVSASRESWLHALKTSHRLVEQKRRRF